MSELSSDLSLHFLGRLYVGARPLANQNTKLGIEITVHPDLGWEIAVFAFLWLACIGWDFKTEKT